jgi:hypothetical protein
MAKDNDSLEEKETENKVADFKSKAGLTLLIYQTDFGHR